MYHGPTMRAVLMALDAWADRGVEPPKSNYPRVEDGTLVSVDEDDYENLVVLEDESDE